MSRLISVDYWRLYVAEFQARETMAMRKRVVPRGLHVLCDLTNSE